MKKLFVFMLVFMPIISYADLLSCGVHSINTVYIQGDRDDNNAHANNVFASIDGNPCNGKNLIYIEKANPNYDAFLSGLMTAYAAGLRIGIYVNTVKQYRVPHK